MAGVSLPRGQGTSCRVDGPLRLPARPGGHSGPFHLWAPVNLLPWTRGCLSEAPLSVRGGGQRPEVGSPDHVVILCLILRTRHTVVHTAALSDIATRGTGL